MYKKNSVIKHIIVRKCTSGTDPARSWVTFHVEPRDFSDIRGMAHVYDASLLVSLCVMEYPLEKNNCNSAFDSAREIRRARGNWLINPDRAAYGSIATRITRQCLARWAKLRTAFYRLDRLVRGT